MSSCWSLSSRAEAKAGRDVSYPGERDQAGSKVRSNPEGGSWLGSRVVVPEPQTQQLKEFLEGISLGIATCGSCPTLPRPSPLWASPSSRQNILSVFVSLAGLPATLCLHSLSFDFLQSQGSTTPEAPIFNPKHWASGILQTKTEHPSMATFPS